MIQMSTCTKQNTCYDCDGDTGQGKCLNAGDKGADCPKYHCPNKGDCDNCAFIDSYIEEIRKAYKEET